MQADYFHRIKNQFETRVWINNPTLEEAHLAIAAGAIHVTSNPTFSFNICQRQTAYAIAIIDRCLPSSKDNQMVADMVQQYLIRDVMAAFKPLYDANPGLEGLVAIQGNPLKDEDADNILAEALRYQNLGPQFLAKIPAIAAGLIAIEKLVELEIPVLATEIFSVAQAIKTCEIYEKVCKKTGKRPPFFITHITGIFDDHVGEYVNKNGIQISPELLGKAGCYAGHLQYAELQKRGFNITVLGGGARGTKHFTEMVGGNFHVTLNWSTVAELQALNGAVVKRLDSLPTETELLELKSKLPDFAKAVDPNALSLEEFKDFPPVLRFRDVFVKGWNSLVTMIAERRQVLGL